jgi:alpha-tubulin suppressor-like RCC1 family protein
MKASVLFGLLLFALFDHLNAQTPRYYVANGEYANYILDNSTQTLYGVGQGASGIGSNTGTPGYPILAQFPSANTKISFVAAGLHTGTAVDVNGNVYFTGLNEDGTMGNGTTTGSTGSFIQIPTDINGNAFNNVKYLRMGSSIFTGGQGYGAIIYAIKNDGTLWVWGNTQGGYAGDGTYGAVITKPTQITSFPAGTVITKILVSNIVIALDSAGNVWTWAGNGNPDLLGNASQTDYETPHTITLPGPAADIAGGGFFSYALLRNQSLYGWGWYTGYMGVGSQASSGTVGLNPPSKPMLLDTSLNLPAKIKVISTNNTTTYVILTDGTLWSWGGNECGQAGIGKELNYAIYTTNPAPYGGTTPSPYDWNQDMSTAQYQVHKPVNIAPGLTNFVGLSEGVCAVWYKFAIDANNQLYSWGRNKSAILANGVEIGDYVVGTLTSNYPNSLDVSYVTAINPFQANPKTIISTSPLCITNPTASGCSLYATPANTPPSALINGVKNGTGTVASSTASLDGTASSDNVYISYYVWTQVSGPNTPIISIPSGKTVNLIGLKNGTYVFQLRCTDNGWLSDSTTYTLTVNTGGPQPVDSAGPAQTITLPTNSVTLTGTASEAGGSIASTKWTQVSGPGTATFGNTAALSTTASGLVQGVYVFELTATDANGITVQSTVKITVNPAPGLPVVSAGTSQTITLPTNTVTLTGTASELNGTIVSFKWTQVSGPGTATIGSSGQISTAVSGLLQGVYRFQLLVTDALGITASATVQVTVNAAVVAGPPVVSAGSDQTITLPTNSVTLTATASETNGTIVSYKWVQQSGPNNSTIASSGSASTAVNGLVAGVYSFQITVTDNSGVTATDVVKVTVNAAIVAGPPVVSAGSDQTITLPTNSVTLTATASETNGTIVSYKWVQLSGPSISTIASSGSATTVVDGLAQGVYSFQVTVTDNSGVTATAVVKVTVNPAAVTPGAPVVNAGSNQTITLPTNSATLTATASETGGGTIVSYKWVQLSGPSISTIASSGSASTAVSPLVQGVYVYQITVTDNSGVTATDVVVVTVNAAIVPGAPVVNAGNDQTITLPTSSTTLTATAAETNGTIVSYQWTQLSGPSNSTIVSSGSASTVVSGLVAGVYSYQVTVTDNSGVTATDLVKVTVNTAAPTPGTPSANAGADQSITLPVDSTKLQGSGTEANGTIVSYKWVQLSGPSVSTIAASGSAATEVNGLVQGEYTFQLTVTDNSGVTATDQVNVTVNAAPPHVPPVAVPGPDQTVVLPASVTLDGSGSYDVDGTIVGYEWVQVSGYGGVTITNSSSAVAGLQGLQAGTYVFQLTVTDNYGATGSAQVTITVTGSSNGVVAVAGSDTTIAAPASSAVLNGSQSYSTSGNIVSYNWTEVSGPSTAAIATDSNAVSTVSQLEPGAYVFELTVTDAQGNVDSSSVTVTVMSTTRSVAPKGSLQIYPNPVVGTTVTLSGISGYTGQVLVTMHEIHGQAVMNYEFDQTGDQVSQTIPMPNGLAAGVYILCVRFQGQNQPYLFKLVKQ